MISRRLIFTTVLALAGGAATACSAAPLHPRLTLRTAPTARPPVRTTPQVAAPLTTSTATSAPSVPPNGGPSAPRSTSPESAARGEAASVCGFDWQQSLARRVAAARAFATPGYAQLITPSAVGVANWAGTQADHESAMCSALKAAVVRDALNMASVRFIRVTAVQAVTVGGKPAGRQPFSVVYRVERQPDGGWLVGGLSGGD